MIDVHDNRVLRGVPLRASAIAMNNAVNRSANEQYDEHGVVNASKSFVSLGHGTVWIVGPNVGWNPSPSRDGPRERDVSFRLRDSSLRIDFDCDGTPPLVSMQPHDSALILSQPPEAGPLFVQTHSGETNWAYVGADNAVRWAAKRDVRFFGHIGGDPAKAFVVQLEHPNGTNRWYGVPTTYRLGIGEVLLRFQGPAGDYRLSASGAGSWLFSFRAIVVQE